MERFDAAIVGAGAVGLAAAARLAAAGHTVLVLEAHARHGVETSSRSSEVVHAGIYYPRESLKNRLCHAGRRWLYRHAADWGFFIRKTGKLVVAVDDAEAARLSELKARAEAGGAEGLELIDGAQARRRAPGLAAAAALWSPASGILDSEEFMAACRRRAEDAGADFLFGAALAGVERRDGGYALSFAGERAWAKCVVNAAGLYADKVMSLAGLDVDALDCRLHWCKGRYFRWRKAPPLAHLIYPLPARHGLGIHLTLDRAGAVRLGPDACFVDAPTYDVPADLAAPFAAAVRRYWPSLDAADLAPDTAGIRPKLAGPDGDFRDFVIAERSAQDRPGWIDCVGIESPGLTAAPAIADMIAELAA